MERTRKTAKPNSGRKRKKKEGKKKKKEETIVLLLQSAGLVYSPHNTDACRMDTLAL